MIITKTNYKTSSWSGGTTTELFIYPPESSYQKRDFQIRISSATVDIEESNFTKLPGYNRVLMILDGQLELNHQGKYQKKLSQYECDYFDGTWETSAKGKVIDFNLMTSKSLQGDLKYKKLVSGTKFTLTISSKGKLIALYLISGKLLSEADERILEQGDLIVLQNQGNVHELQVLEDSNLIQIFVDY